MNLLTMGNPKTMKGEKLGFLTFILHLAPAELSGYNVCPMSSVGCRAACLNTAGRGGMFKTGTFTNAIQAARIRKTQLFFEDRDAFMVSLVKDIENAIKYATKKGMVPAFRLNGTSDIRWENIPVTIHPKNPITGKAHTIGKTFRNVMAMFPNVQFYDYTKIVNRRDVPKNYHLTFSRSEENESSIAAAFENGMNVAVVFHTVPKEYNGRPVVDGDESDLRFIEGAGVYVGLKAKGKAKKDTTSNFVVAI